MLSRISRLHARFASRAGQTSMIECCHEAPLKISKTHEFAETPGQALVCIMDASPGMLDGDVYEQEFFLSPGSQVYATTQSYAKIHPTPRSCASLKTNVYMDSGSWLEYFTQPVVPYRDSRFYTDTRIRLQAGAQAILAEILTPGRLQSGECFAYSLLSSRFDAFRGSKRIAWDHFRLCPATDHFHVIGNGDGYTHVGTLWIFSESVTPGLILQIREICAGYSGVRADVSRLAMEGAAVRALGNKAWMLQELFERIRRTAKSGLMHPIP